MALSVVRQKQRSLSYKRLEIIITARNGSCGKVMFSQVSVCPQGGGVCMSGPRSIPGREWVCPGIGYNRMWMGMYTPWTWAWDTHSPVLTHCGGHHNMYS